MLPIGWPFAAGAVAFLLGEFVLTSSRKGKNEGLDRGTFFGFVIAIAMAFAIDFGVYFTLPPSAGSWNRILFGLGLALFAVAIRVAAKRQLGRFFSMTVNIQEGHRLIQTGLYSRIRHPLYSALDLFFLSWPLTIPSATGMRIGLGAGILVVLASLWRIRVEERALAGRFGEEWKAYVARTGGLIPGA